VRCDSRVLILDAGTGIRPLGEKLEAEGIKNLDLLISHPHIDHLQGFPFFNPAYDESVEVCIHMPPRGTAPSSEPFDRLMEAPHFPVIFKALPAHIEFHKLSGTIYVGAVLVRTFCLNHPGGSMAMRLEFGGKSVVYMTDHEPYTRLYGQLRENHVRDQAVVDFMRGADVLIREAQYTAEEYPAHKGWGHGTFEDAVDSALEANVKSLYLFHHDPDHDDDFLDGQVERMRQRAGNCPIEIHVAREGDFVSLTGAGH
jgi:phosphoribosyl 1,2-cyclic phosphodiesterase